MLEPFSTFSHLISPPACEVWINSNMQSHESFTKCACQAEYEVIELQGTTGTRRVGLVAVLSNEANLYKPGAFGGAEIEDPWETLEFYKAHLKPPFNTNEMTFNPCSYPISCHVALL